MREKVFSFLLSLVLLHSIRGRGLSAGHDIRVALEGDHKVVVHIGAIERMQVLLFLLLMD